MKMSYRTLLTALACVAVSWALSGMMVGCAASDCTDTATCEGSDDESQTDDGSLFEAAQDVASDQAVVSQQETSVNDVVSDVNVVEEEELEDTAADTATHDTTEENPDGGSPEADSQVEPDADSSVVPSPDAADATVIPDARPEDAADADATIEAAVEAGPDAHDATVDVADARPDAEDAGPDVVDAADAADAAEEADVAVEACDATPGYECVPPVPGNWSGPATFWTAPNGSPIPSCAAAYIDAYQGLDASPDTCNCACAPSGQTCSATVQVYSDKACANTCATLAVVDAGCTALEIDGGPNTCGSQGSIIPSQTEPGGGTCAAQFAQIDAGPPTWATAIQLCSATPTGITTGCTGNAQCMPAPTAPYTSTCVYQNGTSATCPAGYTRLGPTVYYRGTSDDRGCSQCTCAAVPPTGGTCTGYVNLYGSTDCTNTPEAYAYEAGVACPPPFGDLGEPAGSVKGVFSLSVAGTCGNPTANSVPDGGVTGTNPLTVCCM
jgi:hypothetical protein